MHLRPNLAGLALNRYDLHGKYEVLHNSQIGDLSTLIDRVNKMSNEVDSFKKQLQTDESNIGNNGKVCLLLLLPVCRSAAGCSAPCALRSYGLAGRGGNTWALTLQCLRLG